MNTVHCEESREAEEQRRILEQLVQLSRPGNVSEDGRACFRC